MLKHYIKVDETPRWKPSVPQDLRQVLLDQGRRHDFSALLTAVVLGAVYGIVRS